MIYIKNIDYVMKQAREMHNGNKMNKVTIKCKIEVVQQFTYIQERDGDIYIYI